MKGNRKLMRTSLCMVFVALACLFSAGCDDDSAEIAKLHDELESTKTALLWTVVVSSIVIVFTIIACSGSNQQGGQGTIYNAKTATPIQPNSDSFRAGNLGYGRHNLAGSQQTKFKHHGKRRARRAERGVVRLNDDDFS